MHHGSLLAFATEAESKRRALEHGAQRAVMQLQNTAVKPLDWQPRP